MASDRIAVDPDGGIHIGALKVDAMTTAGRERSGRQNFAIGSATGWQIAAVVARSGLGSEIESLTPVVRKVYSLPGGVVKSRFCDISVRI